MVRGFVHLHVHSYYSLLDGCPSPLELARTAANAGFSALALTDHNALYGAIEFYDACRAAGLRPILGMELAVDLAQELGDGAHGSLVLLAQDREAYANLCRLSTALQTQPDRDRVWPHGLPVRELGGRTAGLIALSGGKQGCLDRFVRSGQFDRARATAAAWVEHFGRGDFFVELQIQAPGDAEIAARLAHLADELGVPAVATNNVHYLRPDGAAQCQLLSALNLARPLAEMPPREGLDLAPTKSMHRIFAGFPDAVANTEAIAERCHLELPLGRPVFPQIELPTGQTPMDQLRLQALQGAAQRYPTVSEAACTRLDREIDVIDGMGYTPLFLIVADIVRYAREQEVPVNLRGSAAGSLVVYCLGISDVDPLALDLQFERFLNPERRDPPDIDLDFCYDAATK